MHCLSFRVFVIRLRQISSLFSHCTTCISTYLPGTFELGTLVLLHQRSRSQLGDHFVRLSVCLSVCRTFGLLITFLSLEKGISYLARVFLRQAFLDCTIYFEHVAFTVTFDLHLENFNSSLYFLTIRCRAFI